MLLTDILEKSVKEFPNNIALVMRMGYRTVSLTYKEVYDLSIRIACFLEKNGVKNGDNVLLIAPNSPYWVCIFWGVVLRGARLVPLNTQMTSETVRKIIQQTEAKIIFKFLHYTQEFPAGLKIFDIELIKEDIAEIDYSNFKKSEDDLIQILYTSGTTGDPKGVMLSHNNIASNVSQLNNIIPISPSDRFLSILPLSHIFEQVVGFLLPFQSGAKIVYAHSPALVGELLQEYHITKMAAVPEFLKLIMNKIEAEVERKKSRQSFNTAIALSHVIGIKAIQRLIFFPIHKQFGGKLRTVASGGAPLDKELEKKWSALGVHLLQGYGLTETSPIVSCNTYTEHRMGSVGKVLPGVEVKIAEDLPAQAGGEILVKGPNVFQGYFKDEEKTEKFFTSDGWFRTGDIGEFDKEGFLYIKGRKKYIILGSGGQNVYPDDIEFELNKISEVKDSCVVGLEKSGGVVEIHAVLLIDTLLDSQRVEKIINQANKNLASYQRITGWSVWPEENFPRSATRKVKKEEVIHWLREKEEKHAFVKDSEGKGKTQLASLLAEITGVQIVRIKDGTNIVRELNLDSLLRVELVARIEERFGMTIDEFKITPTTTVSDLEKMIKTAEPKKRITFKHGPISWWATFNRMFGQLFWIFPLTRTFVKLKVEGKENIKNLSLPAIFMPNHLSVLDSVVILMALPFTIRKKIALAAAYDLFYEGKYASISWLLELFFNIFPFQRREYENIRTGLEYMGRLLDKGWSVVIHPEGKMSTSGKLGPLKRGTGFIAIEMDSYIVPVKIVGTNSIVPNDKVLPRRRGAVSVTFGKPIKFSKRDSYIEATERIQEALEKL